MVEGSGAPECMTFNLSYSGLKVCLVIRTYRSPPLGNPALAPSKLRQVHVTKCMLFTDLGVLDLNLVFLGRDLVLLTSEISKSSPVDR